MRAKKIFLGFEVGSGDPVNMRLHHTVVTGMTQLSGKTTTLEAIIKRSGLRAIAFKTKRGEAGFTDYNEIPPFFTERADWRYVQSILEATMRERMRFERSWIIKASKGAKTLKDVYKNVVELKGKARKDSLSESVYTVLEEYLKIVIPQIDRFEFSRELSLTNGVNVMELTPMSLEMRSLVIRSVMEFVIDKKRDVIIIIPEAWEYLPQMRSTPVKWFAETFIRKGASIGNYLFVDSQDIAGIDKAPLRQCDNWIMGRQREIHEVERLRKTIGKKFASENEIRSLPLGHFFASIGDQLKKIYVLPVGVPEEMGRKVAVGELKPEDVRDYIMRKKIGGEEELYRRKYEELLSDFEEYKKKSPQSEDSVGLRLDLETERKKTEKLNKKLEEVIEKETRYKKTIEDHKNANLSLEKKLIELENQLKTFESLKKALNSIIEVPSIDVPHGVPSEESPESITVQHEAPSMKVVFNRKRIETDTETLLGKIVYLYAQNELGQDWFSQGAIYKLFARYGWNKDPRTKDVLIKLANWGYLETKLAGRRTDYRVLISPEDARARGLLVAEEVISN